MNLGWIKVIGELEKRTKEYVLIQHVLEMRINPINNQIGVFPIDYPLNMEVMDYMKIYDKKLEYSKEAMKGVKNKYYEIIKYLKTGVKELPAKIKIIDEDLAKKMLEHEDIN